MIKIAVPHSCKLKSDGYQDFRPKAKPKQLIFATAGGSLPPPNGPDKNPSNFNRILSDKVLKKFKAMNNNIDTFTRRGFNIMKKFK